MSETTAIGWTGSTWNPSTGCSKISPACAHCYIERTPPFRIAGRRFVRGVIPIQLHPERLAVPATWRRPRRIFVDSLSDLFHADVPDVFLDQVYDTMETRAPWHTYQVLTKRVERMAAYTRRRYGSGRLAKHIWHGATIETRAQLGRLEELRSSVSWVRFLSVEPILGPLGRLDLTGIQWVIAGGESGPGFRAPDPAWVLELRDQALEQGAAFYFKQWGGKRPESGGRLLEGRTWDEFPA